MILNGNAYDILKTMDDKSIHMGVTSPGYYSPGEGIRDYREKPKSWIGDWIPVEPIAWPDGWIGDLGAEPTPQEYINHLALISMEFYRVLRDDGTFWFNIGDSHAGSGRGPSGKNAAIKNQEERQGFVGTQQKIPPGFKRTDIFATPFRTGIALQEKGWYWKDCIPWIKRNGMIGSYTSRPVTNIEWILILTKSPRPYYDHVAVLQKASESYLKDKRPRGTLRQRVNKNTKYDRSTGQFKKQDLTGNFTYVDFNKRYKETGTSDKRFFRSSDFFFKSFQGLLLNEEDDPLAMVVNPISYRGCHFATFPVLLPQTCILASTSEKGVCPKCGAPWKRNYEKHYIEEKIYEIATTGWEPTCSCGIEETISPTVLDMFNGSGTTGVACKNTGRSFVGIEHNPNYVKLGQQRIKDGK